MTILCLGDSNTYGYDPQSYFGDRYPADVRWTERMGDWKTINCGMNGLPVPYDAAPFVDLVRSKEPDLVVVMLGSNDLLEGANASAVAMRMEAFLTAVQQACPNVLLVAPPPMQPGVWVQNRELIDESAALGKAYCNLAKRLGVSFVDAGQWQIELAYDGVHFTPAGHRAFAKGLLKVLNKSA